MTTSTDSPDLLTLARQCEREPSPERRAALRQHPLWSQHETLLRALEGDLPSQGDRWRYAVALLARQVALEALGESLRRGRGDTYHAAEILGGAVAAVAKAAKIAASTTPQTRFEIAVLPLLNQLQPHRSWLSGPLAALADADPSLGEAALAFSYAAGRAPPHSPQQAAYAAAAQVLWGADAPRDGALAPEQTPAVRRLIDLLPTTVPACAPESIEAW